MAGEQAAEELAPVLKARGTVERAPRGVPSSALRIEIMEVPDDNGSFKRKGQAVRTRKLVGSILVSLGAAWCGQVSAASAAAQDLLEKSGMTTAIQQISSSIVTSGVEAEQKLEDGKDIEATREAYKRAFSTASLTTRVHEELDKSLSAVEFELLRSWFESKTGKRVVELDMKHGRDERAEDEILRDGGAVLGSITKKRGELFKAYAGASLQAEMTADLVIKVMVNASMPLLARSGVAGDREAEAMMGMIEQTKTDLLARLKFVVLAQSALRYEGLTDEELEELVAFESSVANHKFGVAAMEGIGKALQDGSESLLQAERKRRERSVFEKDDVSPFSRI